MARSDAGPALRVPRSWLPRHRTPADRRGAVWALRRYYGRMGFERVGRTPYYGLSMIRPAPTLSDLLGISP